MADDIKKYPAKGMRELDVKKIPANAIGKESILKKALDVAPTLVRSSPIGRGARAIKGALKATGLMGAGYGINEAEDVIKEKMEKKKTGGAVFIPRGQKMFQVNKQKSRIT